MCSSRLPRSDDDMPKSNGCVWNECGATWLFECGAITGTITPGDRGMGNGAAAAVGGDVPCIARDIVCLTAGA